MCRVIANGICGRIECVLMNICAKKYGWQERKGGEIMFGVL